MPEATPWRYNFPLIEHPLSLGDQIRSIAWEVREATVAHQNGEELERVAEELMDVVHRAETALAIIEGVPFKHVDLDGVKRKVVAKNAERGYYGEEGAPVVSLDMLACQRELMRGGQE